MRLGNIVAHLMKNEEELVAIIQERQCILNIDSEELEAIIEVFTSDDEDLMRMHVTKAYTSEAEHLLKKQLTKY